MDTENNGAQSRKPLPPGVVRNGENLDKLNFGERIIHAIIIAFSRLPLRILYVMSDLVYLLMYRVAGYRRRVVRDNLRLAFPDKSEEELYKIEKKFYHHLSDYFFETIKSLTIRNREIQRRMIIRNPELFEDLLDQGRSPFLYSAHLGNWEWFSVVPFYTKYPFHAFYQAQNNRLTNRLTLESRTRHGVTAVESKKGFRYTVECIREKKVFMTLIIGDQCPHHTIHKYWLPFCGQDTPFITGPEHIARKLNLPLIYPSYVSYRRGHYEVELKLIAENPKELPEKEVTARYAQFIEEDLSKLPHLWLWSHRRWKLKHEDFPDE